MYQEKSPCTLERWGSAVIAGIARIAPPKPPADGRWMTLIETLNKESKKLLGQCYQRLSAVGFVFQ
jgi:hypothetical protein